MHMQIPEPLPLVSVIVPVYNAERFLEKCVNSVIHQTYENIELILIDDGSADHSGEVCERFAQKDGRIIIRHKQNGGVSSARNEGLRIAKGKYAAFLDGDDWLPREAIASLVKAAEETRSDFAMGQTIFVSLRRKFITQELPFQTIGKEQADRLLDYVKPLRSPWAKLFSMKLIQQNGLHFIENVCCAEDTAFVWEYLNCCNQYVFIPQNVYYYSSIRLNNACAKCFPEANRWLLLWLKQARKLLKSSTLPASELREKLFAQEIAQLRGACSYYVKRRQLSRDEAIAKIAETCALKDAYITAVPPSHSDAFLELVNSGDYPAIFQLFLPERTNGLVRYLRRSAVRVRQVLVYGIFSSSEKC